MNSKNKVYKERIFLSKIKSRKRSRKCWNFWYTRGRNLGEFNTPGTILEFIYFRNGWIIVNAWTALSLGWTSVIYTRYVPNVMTPIYWHEADRDSTITSMNRAYFCQQKNYILYKVTIVGYTFSSGFCPERGLSSL